ncbi:hypothetical protein [Paraburkholderia sp.]|uniref:hypothetical protein n=1 Tax=Paraburkholderia sp. TaxID=1926495 RepID=UPI00286F90BF|nr:hypothetical protein [Paraburkholderia sp.]
MDQTGRLDARFAAERAVQATEVRDELATRDGIRGRSAVSWSAVVAGAVAMAAFALILLMLGTGLGLSSLSPWPGSGAHAKAFGFAAIVWICVTQILSAGLGGYLAGRLRRHWPGVGVDETHFRDTAHGFLAWALATLLTAFALTSALSGLAREGVSVAAAHESASGGTPLASGLSALDRGNALAAYRSWPMGYMIDGLLRPVAGAPSSSTQNPAQSADAALTTVEQKQEIARIFLNSLPAKGALSPEDSDYVAAIVAQRTGLAPAVARARVTTTWGRLQYMASQLDDAARAAADAARKATIHVTLWLFVSLLLGAFVASLMATVGARLREW